MASTNIRMLSLGSILIQSGNGVPNHISPKGTQYTDLDTAIEYINKDGIATWATLIDSTISGSFSGGTVTGTTFFSSGLSASTFSATTYLGLPTDVFISGGTYSAGTASFKNTTGGTFTVTGFSTSNGSTFTGGTISGATKFTNGLSANTFSATTYLGLPLDIYTTGATYNSSIGVATFKRNDNTTYVLTNLLQPPSPTPDLQQVTDVGNQTTNGIIADQGNNKGSAYLNIDAGDWVSHQLSSTDIGENNFGNATIYLDGEVGISLSRSSGDGLLSTAIGLDGQTVIYATDGTNHNEVKFGSGGIDSAKSIRTNDTLQGKQLNLIDNYGFSSIASVNDIITHYNASDSQVGNELYKNYIAFYPNSGIKGNLYTPSLISNKDWMLPNASGTLALTSQLSDTYVTGGTYTNGTTIFRNNTGGTFSITGFTTPFTGGTVTGQTIFTNGISGNTISGDSLNINSYIQINTGTTAPNNISGRIYYDPTTVGLSYNSYVDPSVKVKIGRQLHARVKNNTAALIPKGSALTFMSATNGIPNVNLAVSSANTNNIVFGLAADDINIGSIGIAITAGIISGLTLNTFNIGDVLYLSDVIPGSYVATTSSLQFSSRSNRIGYVTATGTTTGEIYIDLGNEDTNLSITDIERNILEGNVISTGAYQFSGITTSSTTINVASVNGWVVINNDSNATNPDVINVFYSGGTNIPLTYLNTADNTFLLITSGGTLLQLNSFPTPQQRRQNIYIGKVIHPTRTVIQNANNTVDYDVSPMSAIRDMWTPLKLINMGIAISPNGTNLSFNKSFGNLWGNGINFATDQLTPNTVNLSATTPTTFQYRTQTGGTFSNTTTLDVTHYDVGGVVTLVPGGGATTTNQRVYLFSTGVVRIQYGQQTYTSLANAIAGLSSEVFVEFSNNRDNGILIGVISVSKNATSLLDTTRANFMPVSKFGEISNGGGGSSTTTLQQAYDNSTTPEIVINAALDGLTIQNGTGNADNVTNVFEVKNTAGTSTAFLRADGLISGATIITPNLTATTISATTYVGLPLDVRTTGGTYSDGISIFTNNNGGTFSVSGYSTGYTLTSTGITTALGYTPADDSNTVHITGNETITGLKNFKGLIASDTVLAGSGSLAGSLLDLTQTFNTTGAPSAIKFNLTDTASSSVSRLLDLRVGNTPVLQVSKAGVVVFGTFGSAFPAIGSANPTTGAGLAGGQAVYLGGAVGSNIGYGIYLAAQSGTRTTISGSNGHVNIKETFAPTSGTGTYDILTLGNTINQTGGANGITRGLYVNPTLTAAADFRGLEVAKGSIVLPYQAASATYAVKTSDYLIDCTSGTFTATLPTAVGCQGKTYVFKNSGAGVITIATTSSQTIDGSTTKLLATQYLTATVVSNGANWIVI